MNDLELDREEQTPTDRQQLEECWRLLDLLARDTTPAQNCWNRQRQAAQLLRLQMAPGWEG